jgi:hypothetical protein
MGSCISINININKVSPIQSVHQSQRNNDVEPSAPVLPDEHACSCWICMDTDGSVQTLCDCPSERQCHKLCLAQWQINSKYQHEETHCRFCNAAYPDWKESVFEVLDVQKLMRVNLCGTAVYNSREVMHTNIINILDTINEYTHNTPTNYEIIIKLPLKIKGKTISITDVRKLTSFLRYASARHL